MLIFYLSKKGRGGFVPSSLMLKVIMSKYFTRLRNDNRSVHRKMNDDLKKFRYIFFKASKSFKLKILIKFSKKKYKAVSKEYLKQVRIKLYNRINLGTVYRYNGIIVRCKLCEKNNAECRHHIIQINHGGNPFKRKNQIALCNECHKKVHPLMKK